MDKKLIIVIALLVFFGVVSFLVVANKKNSKKIESFEDCVAAGYPILDSNPPQCKTSEGRSFTAPLNSAEGAPEGSIHNLPVPDAVSRVRSMVADRENVEENQVVILEVLDEEWPDGCLGISEKDQACTQVITRGFRVKASVQGKEYLFRTNSDGSLIKEER